MRNGYEKLITVKEYVKTLVKYNPADENSMISADEYAASLQEEVIASQVSSLITVKDYVNSLYNENYKSAEELEMEANLEEFLSASKKARKDAQTLEQLMA